MSFLRRFDSLLEYFLRSDLFLLLLSVLEFERSIVVLGLLNESLLLVGSLFLCERFLFRIVDEQFGTTISKIDADSEERSGVWVNKIFHGMDAVLLRTADNSVRYDCTLDPDD